MKPSNPMDHESACACADCITRSAWTANDELTEIAAAEDEWRRFYERRDRELADLVRTSECLHGAPEYANTCVESGDGLWCRRCGSLAEWANYADAGHQSDLPNDAADGRGFGWTWEHHAGRKP